MDLLIRENLTFATPDLAPVLKESAKSKKNSSSKRLIVEIAAIHEGITKNFNKYTADELNAATSSWMQPFPKPLIVNHNIESEPLGRMVNAEFKKNAEGVGYIQLRAAVLDPLAAAKIIDGRYLTGSVGGIPTGAICSICHSDVVAAAREGVRCGHERGRKYDEKVCVYEHRGISFHEYSFVNAPGDSMSQVQGHIAEADANLMSVYSIDFEEGRISKFQESDGFVDIREMVSEAEAYKTYLDIAFGNKYVSEFEESQKNNKNIMFEQNISTIAEESGDSDLEHKQMTDKETVDAIETDEQDEDILDVAGRLNADLSEESEETDEQEVVAEDADETSEDESKVEEEEATPEESEVVAENDAEETTEESNEQEAVETVEGADAEAAQEAEADEGPAAEEPEAVAASEEETPSEEAETSDAQVLQARIAELEAEVDKLKGQNKRMKEALHAELAEKVVDARIAVGHIDAEDREQAIEEHKARSASSLADALVDIRKFAEKNNYEVNVVNGTVPSLDIKPIAVAEEAAPIEAEDSDETEVQESVDPKEILVNELSAMLVHGTEKYHRNRSKKLK